MSAAPDELVDIVDEHDRVVAVVTRQEMRRRRLRHRAVFIAVQNSRGQLLVHQRSFAKDVRPGAWDIAFGGVVAAGEAYHAAALRELAEEAGIVGVELVPLVGGLFGDEHCELFGRCYHVVFDGPVSFTDGEVIDARWIGHHELQRLLRNDDVMHDSVALLLDQLTVTG